MRGGEPRGNRTLVQSCCRRRSSPENRLAQSGQRESNPHRQLGRLGSYRWTMSAMGGAEAPPASRDAEDAEALLVLNWVESARFALASPGCRPGTLLLSYDPAGREGIEPSLRVLEARPVTMTLRPRSSATRIGKEVFAPVMGTPPSKWRRLGSNRCTPCPAFAEGDP